MSDDGLHPRVDGTVPLPDGRRLGFAEFGPVGGRPMLWFHGTPGSCHQVPPAARRAAQELGVRLIGVDRPGYGLSTPHCHDSVLGVAEDVVVLLDALGIERLALVGLSGGGPYVLACAHRLRERVVAAGLLGGVAPSDGPDAVPGGLVSLAVASQALLPVLREPLGWMLRAMLQAMRPVADIVAPLLIPVILPAADARDLENDELRDIFVGDILRASRRWMSGPFYDATLFTRPWGFSLADVHVPVCIWQGDADDIVPLAHGVHQSTLLPQATITVQPGHGHLGGLAIGTEVMETLLAHWPEADADSIQAG